MTQSLTMSLLTVLSLAPAAWAAQPLITDDTGTQGKGAQQLEWAHSAERVVRGLDRSRSLAGAWTYTLGASDQVGRAAGREGHDQRHGTAGIGPGLGRAQGQGGGQHAQPVFDLHGVFLSVVCV